MIYKECPKFSIKEKPRKIMKLILNTSLLILILLVYENKTFALTDYQIRKICQKERKRLNCIKNLKNQRFNLLQGNRIEIPVIPFKR